ncbi:unnamed protein product [Brassica rapa subsp. narinosa]
MVQKMSQYDLLNLCKYVSAGGHGERLRSRQRCSIGYDVEAPTRLETPQKISLVEKKGDCGGGAFVTVICGV